jgi:hypothetical protein
MDATTLLITVYCLIDDWLAGRRLRQRGPNPILADRDLFVSAFAQVMTFLSHTATRVVCSAVML